jgi:hypothetical protein
MCFNKPVTNEDSCRLLVYKNPVRTSQETHYIASTDPSRLMLCNIWDFHGGDYEECRFFGCDAVWLVRTNVSEERITSIIWVTRINWLRTTLSVAMATKSFVPVTWRYVAHVRTHVVPKSLILFALMIEARRSSETSFTTRATRRHIQEDDFLYRTQFEVTLISIHVILAAALGPRGRLSLQRKWILGIIVGRNGDKGRPTGKTDVTAVYGLMVYKCGSPDVSQPYMPPGPVTGITWIFLSFTIQKYERQTLIALCICD